jgi:hypothetical protein
MLIGGCAAGRPDLAPDTTPLATANSLELPFVTSSPTTSSPTSTPDYTPLILKSDEIGAPDATYSGPAPTRDPKGVAGAEVLFTSSDQTRAIGITVVVLSDPAAAGDGLPLAEANLSTVVTTTPSQAVPVGNDAAVFTGTSRDRLKAATALVFREDRAIVRIDFYSLPDQPTPIDLAVEVGQKQAIAVRVGLSR